MAYTAPLVFPGKLERIAANPNVALAYHAREHGFAEGPAFVLVQGTASYDPGPAVRYLRTAFCGPRGV